MIVRLGLGVVGPGPAVAEPVCAVNQADTARSALDPDPSPLLVLVGDDRHVVSDGGQAAQCLTDRIRSLVRLEEVQTASTSPGAAAKVVIVRIMSHPACSVQFRNHQTLVGGLETKAYCHISNSRARLRT